MTHRLNLLLLALAALFGLPYYWLMLANPSRHVPPQPVSLTELRRLADVLPGRRPISVEAEYVGWRRVPGNFYAAGSGLKRRPFGVLAFRLPVPGHGGLVIDSGITASVARTLALEGFMPQRQAEVNEWLASAGLILATSERQAHMGGLAAFAASPGAAKALARTRLNPWQVPAATVDDFLPWPPTLVLRPALSGTNPHPIAPGVVIVPTGSPADGSQMIYVRLASGREYVFAGDVAPFEVNLTELRVRSNLLDRAATRHQRTETMRWLVTMRQWRKESPSLVVVPGHDVYWLALFSRWTGITLRQL